MRRMDQVLFASQNRPSREGDAFAYLEHVLPNISDVDRMLEAPSRLSNKCRWNS
jgi:hypothetical protein